MTNSERTQLWKHNNPAKANAQARRYYAKHQPLLRQRNREWLTANPEWRIWQNIQTRCNNPKTWNYKNYGGRGIKCLYQSYQEFIEDVGPRPSKKYSIDRINNEGHYERGNCRWATATQQAINRRPFVPTKWVERDSRTGRWKSPVNTLDGISTENSGC